MEQLTLWDNEGNVFKKAFRAVLNGDIWIRLDALLTVLGVVGIVVGTSVFGTANTAWVWAFAALTGVGMGLGYWSRGQYAKGTIFAVLQTVLVAFTYIVSIKYVMKLDTLGDVLFEQTIDWDTGETVVNDYDHSFKILLYSVIALFIYLLDALVVVTSWGTSYRLLLQKRCGKRINNLWQDIVALFDEKFHLTLLSLPGAGVMVFTVMPLLVLIFIAFTNYDSKHLPPQKLFTWVGMDNFMELMASANDSAFSYAFRSILGWTLLWAVVATFTCYIGGILLSMLLNSKYTKLPKLWRTMFVICIAVPQFITLMLIARFFGDFGIANTMFKDMGITGFLQSIGLIKDEVIPFLSDPTWAKVMIIVINMWIGLPYQMLIATGVLMNIPGDIVESSKIDGASGPIRFVKITMPYVWSVTGPSVITSIVGNINNFNVIYLLTAGAGYQTTNLTLATAGAKEMDLLITWLFSLTQGDRTDYAMASVIGLIAFIICAAFTLISFYFMQRKGDEKVFG